MAKPAGIYLWLRFPIYQQRRPAFVLGPAPDDAYRNIWRPYRFSMGAGYVRKRLGALCSGTLRFFTKSSRAWNVGHNRCSGGRLHDVGALPLLEVRTATFDMAQHRNRLGDRRGD